MRMEVQIFKRIVRESVPVLTLAAMISMITGATLNLKAEFWASLPVFLMVVPSLNDVGNGLGCIISSRITTLLTLGLIKPELKISEVLKENVIAIAIIGVVSSIYLGAVNLFVANISSIHMEPVSPGSFFAVCLISVGMLTLSVTIISIFIAFLSWRKGLDPDNVTIPIVTSFSDVLGVFCLLVAAKIMGFG